MGQLRQWSPLLTCVRVLVMRTIALLSASAFLFFFLTGCGGTTATAPTLAASSSTPVVAHVVIVVEENHSYSEVIGNSAMPYLNSLANANAYATQYFADTHPSLPDYFMLTTGQLITASDTFSGTVSDNNVVRALLAAGKTWKAYAESLPSAGYLGPDVFPYVRHHNPFAYLSDVKNTSQADNVVPFSHFSMDLAAGQLPNFSFVIPNELDDAHNCPDGAQVCNADPKLRAADKWLQQNIDPLFSDPGFQSSGLLVVVFDESVLSDTAGGGGHIAMVMAGTGVKKGFQSTTTHDHAALLRTIMEVLGLQSFPGKAASVADMSEFF